MLLALSLSLSLTLSLSLFLPPANIKIKNWLKEVSLGLNRKKKDTRRKLTSGVVVSVTLEETGLVVGMVEVVSSTVYKHKEPGKK